jgi:hypothetical protein
MSRDSRQTRCLRWVKETFGILTVKDRAIRLLEEAIELAQSECVSKEDAIRIIEHVYSKPAGDPQQEAGGIGVCLLAYCELRGFSAEQLEKAELDRVMSKDPAWFRKRHNVKAEAGIADKVEEI